MTDFPLHLSNRNYSSDPFPHFHLEDALPSSIELPLIEWLEEEAPWHLTRADFYEQHEFSFEDCSLPETLACLKSLALIRYIQDSLSQSFSTKFDDRVDITAHRLTAGQVIKIHNDYIPGRETHRLLIQLNRSWVPDQGGLLVLFAEPSAQAATKFILPKSRSAFGFEISTKSLHAVSKIQSGSRFTLVYSFYAAP
jgi:Rps23 Pro-64 3,4-dihydroxylase Tpa1-like proline 4-hydroxylase